MKIGFVLSEKKLAKSGFAPFLRGDLLYATRSSEGLCVKVTRLDLSCPITEQYDVIIHKVTDIILRPELESHVENLKRYVASNPGTRLIDPLEAVVPIMDRHQMLTILSRACQAYSSRDTSIRVPVFQGAGSGFSLEKFPFPARKPNRFDSGITWIVVKSLVACSTVDSHKMAYCQSNEAFSRLTQDWKLKQSIVQEYVKHFDTLFKVYVVGDDVYVTKRPSLEILLSKSSDPVYFDSQELPKTFTDGAALPALKIDMPAIKQLAGILRKETGLSLFGFDVIINEADPHEYLVVDLNYFPGYSGFSDFEGAFIRLLTKSKS